ncbi:MAG: hypothetical protein H8K03_21645 [Nitrospira sp.]
MRIQLLLTGVLAMLSANVEAVDRGKVSEQYLCISEQATGFSYDKNGKQWNSATFGNTSKYVLASSSTSSDNAFQITIVGDSFPQGWCRESFDSKGYLYCDMHWGDFRFNKASGRFIKTYLFGYIDVGQERLGRGKITDEATESPRMEIGKCSAF